MGNSYQTNQITGRFEFRVWGRHRKARKLLERLADSSTTEYVEDCYLLIDDPSWNAKLRGDSVKIKQLVAERKGFEHWVSERLREADAAPSPFDELLDELGLDEILGAGDISFDDVVERASAHPEMRALVVGKRRRRFQIGDLRAESTDIELRHNGEVLRTLVIEGHDVEELKALRRQLGIRADDNRAVHRVLSDEFDR